MGSSVLTAIALSLAIPSGATPPGSSALRSDLSAAARYSAEHQGLALLVWQHKLLLERYDNGAKREDRNKAFSVAKSVWGLAAAAAVEEGFLAWDERVSDTLTEWKTDPRKAAIDVRHLLSMTSGLDPGYAVIDDDATIDKLSAAVPLPSVAQPGFNFTYGPANMSALGELFRRKLKDRGTTPLRYLWQRVLSPLGIPGWGTDKAGNPMMAAGVTFTAREMLALGRAFLDGRGPDGQAIVKTSSLGPLTIPSSANIMYGLTMWLNRGASEELSTEVDVEQALGLGPDFSGWQQGCFSRVAPPDMLVLLGSYNQRVYIVPSEDLVIVRQGRSMDFKDADFLPLIFEDRTPDYVME
ncbi:MAG: serine hydrolase domain-containing protein [Myxococcota bacterium]